MLYKHYVRPVNRLELTVGSTARLRSENKIQNLSYVDDSVRKNWSIEVRRDIVS